jgi:hypothetical protein
MGRPRTPSSASPWSADWSFGSDLAGSFGVRLGIRDSTPTPVQSKPPAWLHLGSRGVKMIDCPIYVRAETGFDPSWQERLLRGQRNRTITRVFTPWLQKKSGRIGNPSNAGTYCNVQVHPDAGTNLAPQMMKRHESHERTSTGARTCRRRFAR